MKIRKIDRVEFQKNPIKEVIAQVRFPTNLGIQEGLPVAFQKILSADFPLLEIQHGNTFEVTVGPQEMGELKRSTSPPVFNMSSLDKSRRVSLSSDFIALTFTKYESWSEFSSVWERIFTTFKEEYTPTLFTRFGLRYRNLIDKTELGLSDQPWSNLIHDSAIGHLYGRLIEEPIDESKLASCFSISQFNFDEYSLILQSVFIDHFDRKAFVIDSDFFQEKPIKVEELDFNKKFEVLHADTGSVFQAFLKERLHSALGPKS